MNTPRTEQRIADDLVVVVKLPQRFYDDHVQRDLLAGRIVSTTQRHYRVELDAEDYDELLSDAEHYADPSFGVEDLDASLRGLVTSARATVTALRSVSQPRTMEDVNALTAINAAAAATQQLGSLSAQQIVVAERRRQAVAQLIELGWTLQRIAAALHVTKSAVQRMTRHSDDAMTTRRAKDLQRGDVIASSDGRGDERVTFNRPATPGRRHVRTSRFDHNWPDDKEATLIV